MSAEAHPTHRAETTEQQLSTVPIDDERSDLTTSFQRAVGEYLIRHRSILDILSKLQEASARVQRAVAKSVTVCGCVEIHAARQQVPEQVPEDISYAELRQYVQNHLGGSACDHCRDVLEAELGQTFFYATALCETLNLQATDILNHEKQRLVTLGVFNLT